MLKFKSFCFCDNHDRLDVFINASNNFRLYFVSDDDIVRLLGISGHPQAYIPFVRKCFRGAHSLIFSLPQSAKSGNENEEGVNMTLDLELNSARCVTIIVKYNVHLEFLYGC